MRRRQALHTATTPDGEPVTLWRDAEGYVVRVRRDVLMTSRQHGSETAMVEAALESVPAPRRVLVGGLGMGFTLRAALDRLAADAQVVVVELLAEIVDWNRGALAHLAGHPLDDSRVHVAVDDVNAYLARENAAFDVMLLDIDNGPEAFTVTGNARTYQAPGLGALHRALAPGGVVVVWSAFRSREFEKRLARAGFDAGCRMVRARGATAKGARHWLFVARRSGGTR